LLIELIGPRGVGKSSVAPLLAQRLSIAHYCGLGAITPSGHQLRRFAVAFDAASSLMGHFTLAMSTWRNYSGSARKRATLAIAITRRSRFSAKARAAGDGVLDGGPMHALLQEASRDVGSEYISMTPLVAKADLYLMLAASPEVIAQRLMSRETIDFNGAKEQTCQYFEFARSITRSVITIDTTDASLECTVDFAAAMVLKEIEIERQNNYGESS